MLFSEGVDASGQPIKEWFVVRVGHERAWNRVLGLGDRAGAMTEQIDEADTAVGATQVHREEAAGLRAIWNGGDKGGKLEGQFGIEQASFYRLASRRSKKPEEARIAEDLLSCKTKWPVIFCRSAEESSNWRTMSSIAAVSVVSAMIGMATGANNSKFPGPEGT